MAWRILLLGSLLLGGTVLYQNTCSYLPALASACPQKRADNEQLIVVTRFEGNSEEESERITDAVVESVKQAMGEMSDARIKVLNRTITAQQGSEAAREEGKKLKADVVIWGGQPKTGGNAPIDVNFEVLAGKKEATTPAPPTPGAKPEPPTVETNATASTAEPQTIKLQRQSPAEIADLGFVALGLSRYTVGDWSGTVAKLNRALEVTREEVRESAEIYFYLALAYQNKQEYDEAIENYTRVIQIDPNNADAYYGRGLARYDMKDYDGTIADSTSAIQLNSNYADAYLNRGLASYKKQDYKGAIADYNRALKINPNHAIAYNNRGSTRYAKKDYEGAIADYSRAIAINPDDAELYKNRGIARNEMKDYEGAIADYNRAIALNPNLIDAYIGRGLARYFKKDYESAIADYTRAIQLNPNYAMSYNNRGFARAKKQDYDGAIGDYTTAININPNYAEAYNSRGNARYYKQDYDGAIADYNKSIELQIPELYLSYNNRGLARYAQKDYEGAITDYTTAISINPNYAEAYINRGLARYDKKDYEDAIADYSRVIEFKNQELHLPYRYRGDIYRLIGDTQNARRDYKKALELASNPKDKEIAEQRLQQLN